MYAAGMASANDGNISLRQKDGSILCTPTGVSKGYMEPDMICTVSPEGDLLDPGKGYTPSSEIKMHLGVYKNLPQVNAVVHAHPVYATTFAAAGESLTAPVLIESVEQFHHVPCVKYAAPSTSELADSIVPYLKESTALLMEFHGALTWSSGLLKAYMKMESLEFYARILYQMRAIGSTNALPDDRVAQLLEIKEKLGIE